MRVLLVDDEPLALRGLSLLLAGEPDIEIIGVAQSGDEAIQIVHSAKPDLVFLDIQMPGLSGLDVTRALGSMEAPDIVFVTAFDGYAADAFSVDAVDYLLKPVSQNRLRQSLQRARRRHTESDTARSFNLSTQSVLNLSDRHGELFLAQGDIVWIEAARDYGLIHTALRSHILRTTMAELGEQLEPGILRVHRSAFVAINRVRQVKSTGKGTIALVLDEGTEVQVGPSYAKSVRTALRNLPIGSVMRARS